MGSQVFRRSKPDPIALIAARARGESPRQPVREPQNPPPAKEPGPPKPPAGDPPPPEPPRRDPPEPPRPHDEPLPVIKDPEIPSVT